VIGYRRRFLTQLLYPVQRWPDAGKAIEQGKLSVKVKVRKQMCSPLSDYRYSSL